MSSQIPSQYSVLSSSMYALPEAADSPNKLTQAFDKALNHILHGASIANVDAMLNEGFDQSFCSSMYQLSQIQEWIRDYLSEKNIVEGDNGLHNALAFNHLIYEHYIKKTFPVTFSYFCEYWENLQSCQELSKNLSGVDDMPAHRISIIIRALLSFQEKDAGSKKYIPLLVTCIEKLDSIDKQKLKETLDLASSEDQTGLLLSFINESTSRELKIRLFQYAESIYPAEGKKKFYATLKSLCTSKNYADIPLPLIWALALVSTENQECTVKAHALWKVYANQLSPELKPLFGRVFVRNLANVDPALAIKEFEGLVDAGIPAEKWLQSLKEIAAIYEKAGPHQTRQNLCLLAGALKKIGFLQNSSALSSDNLKTIQWMFSELIKHNCLEETATLWRLFYKNLNPDSPFFSELLIHPLQNCQELKLTIMRDKAFYDNLEKALAILTLVKPGPAVQWKTLFDKIKSLKDKTFCIRVWQAFTKAQKLQGTPREMAEVWLCAVKTIDQKHTPAFLDLLNCETTLFSSFDHGEAEIRTVCLKLIYDRLLYICEDLRPNPHLENLLKFRLRIESECNAPLGQSQDWKAGDKALAEMLSRSSSTQCQIVAFKTAVDIGDLDKAAGYLESLHSKTLNDNESQSLAKPLLSFLSVLPPEKHTVALKTFQAPNCCAVFKHTPIESMQLLYAWYNKITDRAKYTLIFLKIVFDLAPFLEAEAMLPWIEELIKYMEYPHPHPPKLQLVSINFSKVVEILAKSNQPKALFKLLQAVQRLSIKISPATSDIHTCLRMFSTLAKDNHNPSELQQAFLSYMDLIKTKGKVRQLFSAYLDIIQGLDDPLINDFINFIRLHNVEILTHLAEYIQALEGYPQKQLRPQLIDLILSSSVFSLTSFKGKSMITAWNEAEKQIKTYCASFQELWKQIELVKSTLFIVCGNDECLLINDLINKPAHLHTVAQGFLMTLAATPSQGRTHQDLLQQFMYVNETLCKHVMHLNALPREVDSLYNFILNDTSIPLNNIKIIIEGLQKYPCESLLEKSLICMIERSSLELSKQEKNTMLTCFANLLSEVINKNYTLSLNFYRICLKKLSLNQTIDETLGQQIGANLSSLLFATLTKNSESFKNKNQLLQEIVSCYQFCRNKIPCDYKRSNLQNHELIHYLNALIKVDLKIFFDTYIYARGQTLELLKDDQDCCFFFQSAIIKNFSSISCTSLELFLAVHHVLYIEFSAIIEKNQMHNPEMMQLFDKYVFGVFISHRNFIRKFKDVEPHLNQLRELLTYAVGRNKFQNHGYKLFQWCFLCNFGLLDMVSQQLTDDQIQQSFHELVDRLGASPTLISVSILLAYMHEREFKANIKPKEVLHYWKTAFHSTEKVRTMERPLEFALTVFQGSWLPDKAKQSTEWKKVSISICQEAFSILCNPSCSIYGLQLSAVPKNMFNVAAGWLRAFWERGCFGGDAKAYYDLVEQCIGKFPPQATETFDELMQKCTVMMILIMLASRANQESFQRAEELHCKWSQMLKHYPFTEEQKQRILQEIGKNLVAGFSMDLFH